MLKTLLLLLIFGGVVPLLGVAALYFIKQSIDKCTDFTAEHISSVVWKIIFSLLAATIIMVCLGAFESTEAIFRSPYKSTYHWLFLLIEIALALGIGLLWRKIDVGHTATFTSRTSSTLYAHSLLALHVFTLVLLAMAMNPVATFFRQAAQLIWYIR